MGVCQTQAAAWAAAESTDVTLNPHTGRWAEGVRDRERERSLMAEEGRALINS